MDLIKKILEILGSLIALIIAISGLVGLFIKDPPLVLLIISFIIWVSAFGFCLFVAFKRDKPIKKEEVREKEKEKKKGKGKKKYEEEDEGAEGEKEGPYHFPKHRNKAFLGMGVLLGILIGFLLTKLITKPIDTPPPPTITPIPFADLNIKEVTWKNVCGGTITYIPEGFELWILVEQDNTYHPQTGGPIAVDEITREFEGTCLIGMGPDQNIGEMFTVYAVLVDSQGSRIFYDYLNTAEEEGYPGFKQDELPQSQIIIGSMIVRRKEG